jgi:hypothetical protein
VAGLGGDITFTDERRYECGEQFSGGNHAKATGKVKGVRMKLLKGLMSDLNINGILALAAIVSMVVGGTMYAAETRSTANQADRTAGEAKDEAEKAALALVAAADKLAAQQARDEAVSQKHFEKLDSAIELIATIMAERTGRPVSFPTPYDENSSPASSRNSNANNDDP